MKSRNANPNPRRVAAGRRNRRKRRGLTPEGREKLRQAALHHRPWERSTGPKTEAGKATVRLNGRKRQVDNLFSIRDARVFSKQVLDVLADLQELRSELTTTS